MERRSFLRGGLAVGAATAGLTIASSVMRTGVAEASSTTQNNWYWCSLCASLFHSNNAQPDGSCVTSPFNLHTVGTQEYLVDFDEIQGGFQSQWAWCNNCQVLFYGPDVATSGCAWAYVTRSQNARYYPHRGGTTNYALPFNAKPQDLRNYQAGWNYCPACRNIYHGSGNPAGYCVNTGTKHTPGATPYWMLEPGTAP
jgi:hypothetical protein